ncbi:GroES-like protein, partial [Hymenopellis radicata]
MAYRALTYASHGPPSQVLRLVTLPALPPPPPNTVNVKFLRSPVNPADINVIQGVYPVKARTNLNESWIGGNEGVAEVVNVSDGETNLKVGDRVIPCTPQLGTWRARANIASDDLVKVPRDWSLKRAAAASVNPPTAIRMLLDNPSDGWVMQNCANSGVGESVVQVARHLGIKSANFVRDKGKKVDVPGWGAGTVEERLRDLGADEVCEYKDLDVKAGEVAKMIKAKNIKLMLNALSGPYTTAMAKLLGQAPRLVSYGAMSLEPLSFPTSLFIFKGLEAKGFWMHRWYETHSRQEREEMIRTVAEMGLREPGGKEVSIDGHDVVKEIVESKEKVFL